VRSAILALLLLGGCGSSTPAEEHAPPSAVEHPVEEAELARVRLTPQAVARLAIQTAKVEVHDKPATRRLGAEITIPPGRVRPIAAPLAGLIRMTTEVLPGMPVTEGQILMRLVPLAPVDRDTEARAKREVAAARANLAASQARLTRTETLAEGGAGSRRAAEEATATRDISQADLEAAQARLRVTRSSPLLSDVSMAIRAPEDGVVRAVTVATGQTVAAGTPLLELVAVKELWVRAPIYSGDLHRLAPTANAVVESLGANQQRSAANARFVVGPPTASPTLGTVDRYYALDASSSVFLPGERVMLTLPMRAVESVTAVPYSAVLYDANGSEWLYVCEEEGLYRRTRIEVLRRAGELAILGRGPDVGTCVVSVGAAEVFGAEFEPGH